MFSKVDFTPRPTSANCSRLFSSTTSSSGSPRTQFSECSQTQVGVSYIERSSFLIPIAVLSIPTLSVPSTAKAAVSPRHGPSLLNGLREIEVLLSRAMAYSVSRSYPSKLRELSLLTAAHRALHSSAGRPSKRSAATVATTLGTTSVLPPSLMTHYFDYRSRTRRHSPA